MPDPDFFIKRGDTASRIQATLENSGGTPVSIQGANVVWKMAPISGGSLTVSAAAIIDQQGDGSGTAGAMGQVHYNWATADLAASGLYLGEWEVTFASGAVQTFPNGDQIRVAINQDLPT
jgi:hypothetical protein